MDEAVSPDELKRKNIREAEDFFEYFAQNVEALTELVSWDPSKDREKRTRSILALTSLWSFGRGEYVFFDKRYLESIVDLWKLAKYTEDQDEINKWIRMYETRLKLKKELGEVGERFVDLSSSYFKVPICFSFILEYEASPYWGPIIGDFRKLLSVLAPVKVGIFHLPKYPSTSKLWVQDDETGEIKWEDKVLDSSKPDQLIEGMKNELEPNELEHPYTIYLIILIHSPTDKSVKTYGYLLWRELTGEVESKKLEPRI